MAYKCLNNLAPTYLRNRFVKRTDLHIRQTRNNNLLDIPLFRTASGQKSFHYGAVKIWNNLESDLKEIQSLRQFKRNLRSRFLDNLVLESVHA